MPEETRIYTPELQRVRERFASDPFLSDYLYQIDEGAIQPGSPGFLVIRAEDDTIHTICSEQACRTWPARLTSLTASGLAHVYRLFPWFQRARPRPELLALLEDLAYQQSTAIVYYHWMERGDDLYYEFSWGFDYRSIDDRPIHVSGRYDLYGECLYIAQTHLMGQRRNIIRGHAPLRIERLDTDVYDHIPRYLDFSPFHAFFQPDVYYSFDWARYRSTKQLS